MREGTFPVLTSRANMAWQVAGAQCYLQVMMSQVGVLLGDLLEVDHNLGVVTVKNDLRCQRLGQFLRYTVT